MLSKKIFTIIVFVFAGCTIFVLGLLAVLPHVVQSQLEKRLPRISKIHPIVFQIKKIGLFNTHISEIRIDEGILIDSINLDYTVKGFSGIHLKKVVVSGLSIQARLDEDNKIIIPGASLPDAKTKSSKPEKLPFLGYLPEQIVLKNAKIDLKAKGKNYLIPVRALATINTEQGEVTAQASLYPFGEKVDAFISYDLEKGVQQIKIEGKKFNLGCLNPLIENLTGSSKRDQGQGGKIIFNGPVDFSVSSSLPNEKWTFYISRVGIDMPVSAELSEFHSTLLLNNGSVSSQGSMKVVHPMTVPIPIEYKADIHLKDGLSFDMQMTTGKIKELLLEHASNKMSIRSPVVSILVNGNPEEFIGKINLNTKQIRIQSGASEALLPGFSAEGTFGPDGEGRPRADIMISASGGRADLPEYQTKMSGISFKVPYQYPAPVQNEKGHYTIAKISYDNKYRFFSRGNITQTGMKEIAVNGGLGFDVLKNARVKFNADAGFEKGVHAALDFHVDPFKMTDAEIEKLTPQMPKDSQIEITASAKGRAEFKENKILTVMQTDVKDGSIHIPDTKLTVTGVNTTIHFNNLLVPETVPGQMLTIDSIQVDKVKISDAKVRFSIEDGSSLLIENIRFKWCNGLVSTEAIRFPNKTDTYAFSLFCDRLELTQLLEQMGAFNADGSGTLNGRIPIVYSGGDISFDNGFLFSTPGSGGKIVVENADAITAGIPLDSPQFAELDVAREALKNFNYKWAKLAFNTFEDTLYVNMELDGKPSHIMPFEYKKEIGRFVRVDASSPGSHFQGIKLDVNLNLPFNEVMKFGNKLKSIFK